MKVIEREADAGVSELRHLNFFKQFLCQIPILYVEVASFYKN